MSILFFVCSTTGREISSKVDIDRDSFRTMPPVLSDIRCPDCGTIHNLFNVPTRLSDEPDEEDARQARSV
jgi:DNA-directed RNA polymerase subunit RPC12/RpoP